MNNKIELLRSILFDEEDYQYYTELVEQKAFTEKEIEFMIEFKKIYEYGLNQLEKFVNKLDEEGKELDSFSILYYVHALSRGPFGKFLPEYTKDKKYFILIPDSMGNNGNVVLSHQNVSLQLTDQRIPYGTTVDIYNKLPLFIQKNLEVTTKNVENVFRNNVYSSIIIDNTLPCIDKKPQDRADKEYTGNWVYESNGSYCLKDLLSYNNLMEITDDIFLQIKELIGEENFRVYKDLKKFNQYSTEYNTSEASSKIKRLIGTETIDQDILNQPFKS